MKLQKLEGGSYPRPALIALLAVFALLSGACSEKEPSSPAEKSSTAAAKPSERPTLNMGIFPRRNVVTTKKAFRPLAEYLSELAVRSTSEVTFVIGGAFGLGREVLDRSSVKLALSPMTLPHEVARLILAEQLYRARSLLGGHPYHRD